MPKSIPRTHKIQILEIWGLNFRGGTALCDTLLYFTSSLYLCNPKIFKYEMDYKVHSNKHHVEQLE